MSLNSNARLYEEVTIDESRGTALDILENYSPQLRPDMSVLDLACGPGPVTKVIYDHCSTNNIKPPRVIGIDIGPEFIQIFKENKESYHWETAQGIVGDASDLHMCSDDEFDLVIMNYGLFAVADDVVNKAAAEIYRVLKTGGRAILSMWRDTFVFRLMLGASEAVGRPEAEIGYTRSVFDKWARPEKTHDTLVAGGFDSEKISHSRRDATFKSPDKFHNQFWENIGTGMWTEDQKPQWRYQVEELTAKEQREFGGLQANSWIFVADK